MPDESAVNFAEDRSYSWLPSTVDPHRLIVGPHGSGKTTLLQQKILPAALNAHADVWVIDAGNIGAPAGAWPTGIPVACTPQAIEDTIDEIHRLMLARYEAIEARREHPDTLILLVIEEYPSLRKQPHKPGLSRHGHELLRDIIRLGRSASIHLAITSSRAPADLLTGEARDLFRSRISLGHLSPLEKSMMWATPSLSGDHLPLPPGSGFAAGKDGRPVPFRFHVNQRRASALML